MIIIDSNIWIDFFKNIENQETKELSYLLRNKIAVGSNSIIVTEVLQGKREEKEYQRIKHVLNTFRVYRINHETILNAGDIFRTCQNGIKEDKNISGKTMKTCDCIIASSCIENDVMIFSKDKHFKLMAEFFPQLKIFVS